jgi:hypothetical protein
MHHEDAGNCEHSLPSRGSEMNGKIKKNIGLGGTVDCVAFSRLFDFTLHRLQVPHR